MPMYPIVAMLVKRGANDDVLICLLAENGAMRVRADEGMHNKTLYTCIQRGGIS